MEDEVHASSDTAEEEQEESAATQRFYYYQNPTTGTVSNNPLSLVQLVKLLVPVRVGVSPILPPHTQCLAYNPHRGATVGDWQPVTSLPVLNEASCHQWHVTSGTGTTQGPWTCRSMLEFLMGGHHDQSKVLVFAPTITSEWMAIDQLPHLQQVLEALQFQAPIPPALPDNVSARDKLDIAAEAGSQAVQDELEAFLSSTARIGGKRDNGRGDNDDDDDDDDDNDQEYESDGGTKYVKDPLSGRWIHEALAPPREATAADPKSGATSTNNKSLTSTKKAVTNKKPKKKDQFHKRNARNWIYITGLPPNVELPEIQKFFGKVGLLDLDPETLQPKIKLYRHGTDENGGKATLKGDASVCYARPESVDLALQVLDESPWDQTHIIRVERANFQAKENHHDHDGGSGGGPNTNKRDRKTISLAQRKVARLALLQAQDEGFGERLAGGRKGLRIVVVQNMLEGIPEDEWESKIYEYCQELEGAAVDKITCISKTKVVIVKFAEPPTASKAVETWNGKLNPVTKKPMEALYWDGVTDYTQSHQEHNPQEEEKRHEDFGKWLDDQGEEELPPELRLQTADD